MAEDVNQLLHQARISRQQGDIGAALKVLQRAEKLSPGNTQVLLALGNELDAQHEPKKAVSVLQKAFALAPKNPEIVNALGNAEQGARRFERALKCYQQAAKLIPDVAAVHINVGDMVRLLGDPSEAKSHFSLALNLDPNNLTAHYHLAVCELELGDAARSLQHLAAIESATPYLPEGIGLKATALRLAGRVDEASALLNYEQFLRIQKLPIPDGYPNIRKFNRELEKYILGERLTRDPYSASTRGGRHGDDLLSSPRGPAVALSQVLRAAFGAYVQGLPQGLSHPFLSSSGQRIRLVAQANILDSSGYLEDHVHPQAWISAAYYVRLPAEVSNDDDSKRAGWLRFGALPSHMKIQSADIRYVTPEEGRLVIFPSFFYHGTIPFKSPKHRVSLGIDAICR